MVLKNNTIHQIIQKNTRKGVEGVKQALLLKVGDTTEDLIPQYDRLRAYFNPEEWIQFLNTAKQKNYRNLLKFAGIAMQVLPNEDLRDELISIHNKHPWDFYTHADEYSGLFSKGFFEKQLGKDPSKLQRKFLSLMLSYHADAPLTAFDEPTKNLLAKMIGNSTFDVRIGESKEAGFACGGMEANYVDAAESNQGLCLVNKYLLAKMYHRRGNSEKVSYIAKNNFQTQNGFALWKNYFYAPSENQHEPVANAIQNGESHIEISDLIVRPCRPLIGVSSRKIFELYNQNKQ